MGARRKILIGCAVIPVGLFLLLIVTALVVAVVPAPELVQANETQQLDSGLPAVRADASDAPLGKQLPPLDSVGDAAVIAPPLDGRPHRLKIYLEEGMFDIRPGEPGSSIRVDADYNSGAYELVTRSSEDGESFSHEVTFKRTVWALTAMKLPQADNKVTIYIPRGVPIDLELEFTKGQLRSRLDGLALRSVDFAFSMGQAEVDFDELNPIEMEAMDVEFSMGELKIGGIGNAQPRRLHAEATMGSMRLDYGDRIRADAEIDVELVMGEAQVLLPDGARVGSVRRSVMMGEAAVASTLRDDADQPELSGGAPGITVDLSVLMGEATVR